MGKGNFDNKNITGWNSIVLSDRDIDVFLDFF